MDLRKWLLLNDLPRSKDLDDAVKHIPCSEFRTSSVLRLFAAGYRTGFKLTDEQGQPTQALELLAELMDRVELCRAHGLPPEEQQVFCPRDGTLAAVLDHRWFLRGLTDRVKAANTAIGYGRREWVWRFLPGLDARYIRYLDFDGKRRKRVCYLATCPRDWEMTDEVYEGLWKWNREHVEDSGGFYARMAKRPDGYAILAGHPDLGPTRSQGGGEWAPEGHGAAPGTPVPAALVSA